MCYCCPCRLSQGSKHFGPDVHVECHRVSRIELAGADPRAPALLSASPGGATGSSAPLGAGYEVYHPAVLGQGDAGMQVWNLNVF